MGWLDANEFFVIAALARERVDELLSSSELSSTEPLIERGAVTDERGVPSSPTFVTFEAARSATCLFSRHPSAPGTCTAHRPVQANRRS